MELATLLLITTFFFGTWCVHLVHKVYKLKKRPPIQKYQIVELANNQLSNYEKAILGADILNEVDHDNLEPDQKRLVKDWYKWKITLLNLESMKTVITIGKTNYHDSHDLTATHEDIDGNLKIVLTSKSHGDTVVINMDEKEVDRLNYGIVRYLKKRWNEQMKKTT